VQAGYLLKSDWAMGLRFTKLNANTASASYAQYNKHYTFVLSKYIAGNNMKIQTEIGYEALSDAFKTATQKGNSYAQLMFTVQL
jgi:phosphate-selective porin OprO and OprP